MNGLHLPAEPFLLVMVGTDHHPFDRLVGWVDDWCGAHEDARCVVQWGTSRPPRHAAGAAYLDGGLVQAALRRSAAVVCHGGPATITAARAAGRLPVVVPRRGALGEHVDDHQLHFARRLDGDGLAVLVEDRAALALHLGRARREPEAYRVEATGGAPSAAVARFRDLVDARLARPRARREVRR